MYVRGQGQRIALFEPREAVWHSDTVTVCVSVTVLTQSNVLMVQHNIVTSVCPLVKVQRCLVLYGGGERRGHAGAKGVWYLFYSGTHVHPRHPRPAAAGTGTFSKLCLIIICI